MAATTTLERYACTRCPNTKTQSFNDWFRRCPSCTLLHLKPDHPPFITREQALAKEKK